MRFLIGTADTHTQDCTHRNELETRDEYQTSSNELDQPLLASLDMSLAGAMWLVEASYILTRCQ